jgi:flagellar protein FliO/FliZ
VSGGSLFGVLLRLVFSLGVVLALMAFTGRALRNRQLGGGSAGRRNPARIEVLGRQTLGRNVGVAVVRVADRAMLVGVTEGSIQLLTDLPLESFPEPDAEPAAPATPGFASVPAFLELVRERTVRRSGGS